MKFHNFIFINKIIILLILLLLVSGCVEMEYHIKINSDGQETVLAKFIMPSFMVNNSADLIKTLEDQGYKVTTEVMGEKSAIIGTATCNKEWNILYPYKFTSGNVIFKPNYYNLFFVKIYSMEFKCSLDENKIKESIKDISIPVTYIIEVPGNIYKHNADNINQNTLKWSFILPSIKNIDIYFSSYEINYLACTLFIIIIIVPIIYINRRKIIDSNIVNRILKSIKKKFLQPLKKCPYCAESIRVEAIKCKHCHSILDKIEENKISILDNIENISPDTENKTQNITDSSTSTNCEDAKIEQFQVNENTGLYNKEELLKATEKKDSYLPLNIFKKIKNKKTFIIIFSIVLFVIIISFIFLTPIVKNEIAKASLNEGLALYQLKKYEEAIKCFNKAIEMNPNADNISQNTLKWSLYNKGLALYNQGKHEEAIKCFDKILEIDPKNKLAWDGKGNALCSQKNYDEAIKCYDKAIEIDPEDKLAWDMKKYTWDNKGLALYNQGKHEEAIKCYDEALKIVPKFKDAWYHKGLALDNLEKYEEAIECYDKILEIEPKFKEAWYHKGNALDKQGNYDEAIKCYDEALKIDLNYEDAKEAKSEVEKNFIVSIGENFQIDVKDVMKLADEHGKTPKEKYGNAIFASSMLSSFVLMEFGTALMNFDEKKPGAVKSENIKDIFKKNKKTLEAIKIEVEALKPPKGYEGVQEKVISYYSKIFEGVENAIKGIDKNDSIAMAAFNTNMGDATKVLEEAMKELDKKGYKPTEEFQKVVFGMFEQPSSTTTPETGLTFLDQQTALLKSYYNSITSRDYKSAYYLRSDRWRENHSYEEFEENWCVNNTIQLVGIKDVSDRVAGIRIYSEDYPSYNTSDTTKLHKAYYSGKAYFTWGEDGRGQTLYIDDIQVTEE